MDRFADERAQGPRRSQKCLAVDPPGDRRARGFGGGDFGYCLDQFRADVPVVETDAQPCAGMRGDNIGRRIADVDREYFDVRRLEPVGPCIEFDRVDLREDADERGARIVGQMRIGDVPLRPGNIDLDHHRSAPPDLDGIAEPLRRRGLAYEAHVGDQPTRFHPIDQRDGTKGCGPLLVARDDEGKAPRMIGRARRSRHECSDAALHVDCAPAVEKAATGLRFEGCRVPAIPRWHDIEVPGKGEMRTVVVATRCQ